MMFFELKEGIDEIFSEVQIKEISEEDKTAFLHCANCSREHHLQITVVWEAVNDAIDDHSIERVFSLREIKLMGSSYREFDVRETWRGDRVPIALDNSTGQIARYLAVAGGSQGKGCKTRATSKLYNGSAGSKMLQHFCYGV